MVHTEALTGIRGWAATWVLLYHAWVLAGPRPVFLPFGDWVLDFTPFFSCGWAGVQIFFVLSGFLLGLPFAEWQAGLASRPDLPTYLRHRLARVFPAYYAQVLLLAVAVTVTTGYWPIDSWQAAVRHAFMLFVPLPFAGEPLNGVWWTLPIEFSFYLVLPMLATLLRPNRLVPLVLICVATMIAWRYGTLLVIGTEAPIGQRVTIASQLPGSIDSFGFGLLGAALHVNRDGWRLRRWAIFDRSGTVWLGMAIIFSAIYWIHWRHEQYWTPSAIYFAWTPLFNAGVLLVILACAGRAPITRAVFGNRPLFWLGTISYSIYLWHFPVLDMLHSASSLRDSRTYIFPALLTAGLLITLPLAALSYRIVERPFIALARSGGTCQ